MIPIGDAFGDDHRGWVITKKKTRGIRNIMLSQIMLGKQHKRESCKLKVAMYQSKLNFSFKRRVFH